MKSERKKLVVGIETVTSYKYLGLETRSCMFDTYKNAIMRCKQQV